MLKVAPGLVVAYCQDVLAQALPFVFNELGVVPVDREGNDRAALKSIEAALRWSPDSRHLAFTAPGAQGASIYLIDDPGEEPRPVAGSARQRWIIPPSCQCQVSSDATWCQRERPWAGRRKWMTVSAERTRPPAVTEVGER